MKTSRSGLIGRMALVAAAIATLITAGTQQAAGDITTGLIGHWKLDEATGTTAADSSVSGITGTLVNDPLWVAGKINNALDFNGSNQKVTLASNSALAMESGNYTFAAWINPDSTTGGKGIFGALTDGGVGFLLDIGTANYLWLGARTVWDIRSPALPTLNVGWNHVAAVVDHTAPGSATFYVNGVPLSGEPISHPYAGAPSKVGAAGAQTDSIGLMGVGNYWFDGTIDDARIYKRALSAADVLELYNYPPPIMTGSVLIVR